MPCVILRQILLCQNPISQQNELWMGNSYRLCPFWNVQQKLLFTSLLCSYWYSLNGFFLFFRAEPVLTRIKENRKRVISPSFDNIKYDNFEIEEYPLSAQGFDWELWCRYLNPPKSWWKLENTTAPIRWDAIATSSSVSLAMLFQIRQMVSGLS